jgi:uncharacterized GH25 family protein
MEAQRFNNYLEHDGVTGMLQQRKKNGTLGNDAKEEYAKHGKTIFQVGEKRSDDYKMELGYPIEFIPLENPYDKHTGDDLRVKLLVEGKPLADQSVYAHNVAGSHSHGHNEAAESHTHDNAGSEDHNHDDGIQYTTDENGEFTVALNHDGVYYLRTIYMANINDKTDLTHRSKWATLTFEVAHTHGDNTHTHNEDPLPVWWFIAGSLLLIIVLYLVFKKRK